MIYIIYPPSCKWERVQILFNYLFYLELLLIYLYG